VPAAAQEVVAAVHQHMHESEPNRALEATWSLLRSIDGYLQERQPWALAKDGPAARRDLEGTLYVALEGLRITSLLIEPFMPQVAGRLRRQLGVPDMRRDLVESARWGGLPEGTTIGATEALFPRVDIKAYLKEIAMEQQQHDAAADTDVLTIDEFFRTKLVVGTVREAERIPKSKKLMRLRVDLGEAEPRQLVAGIAERYAAEDLVGRQIVVVANLKPAKLMGVESRGMLLAANLEGEPFLLSPDDVVPPGTPVS
jgi:methionyl-tRNA synthetase